MGCIYSKNTICQSKIFKKPLYTLSSNLDLSIPLSKSPLSNSLFERELTDEEIETFDNVKQIEINYLDSNSYIYNLRKLKNLKTIIIKEVNFIEFFDELANLPKLECIMMFENKLTLEPLKVIKSISKCKQIKVFETKINLDYVPKELFEMNNLQDLVFYNIDTNYEFNNIPIEICNLEKFIFFEIPTDIEYVINNDKMFIFNYKKTIPIPENIKKLNIMTCQDDLDNLPISIEILNVCFIKNLPTNLPIGLQKLYLGCNFYDVYNDETNEEKSIDFTSDDIKAPFGCEVEVRKNIEFKDLNINKIFCNC